MGGIREKKTNNKIAGKGMVRRGGGEKGDARDEEAKENWNRPEELTYRKI
jgi:hypothetical protein